MFLTTGEAEKLLYYPAGVADRLRKQPGALTTVVHIGVQVDIERLRRDLYGVSDA